MNVIAFDTASEYLDIALRIDNKTFSQYKKIGLKHSESLIPNINELCSSADFNIRDLDLILCTRGPGSFTGLRVGMSTAKGLASGLQKPLVSIPTLDVYANSILEYDWAGENSNVIIPVIDARKKRFYCAFYSGNVKISDSLDISAEDLYDSYLTNYTKMLFSGPDAELLIKILLTARPEMNTLQFSVHPTGAISEILLNMGIKYFEKYGSDTAAQGPLYIRSST